MSFAAQHKYWISILRKKTHLRKSRKEPERGAERHLIFSWCQLAHSDQGCFVLPRFSVRTLPRALKHTLRHIYRDMIEGVGISTFFIKSHSKLIYSPIHFRYLLGPDDNVKKCFMIPINLKIRTITWVAP